MDLSEVADFVLIYICIFDFNVLHQFPLGRNPDWLPHIVRSSYSTYHPMMDITQQINASSFNVCIRIYARCLYDSISKNIHCRVGNIYTEMVVLLINMCCPWPHD